MAATVAKVLEELTELSDDDREYVSKVEQQRLIEKRREAIGKAAQEGRDDLVAGKLKVYNSVADLKRDLKG